MVNGSVLMDGKKMSKSEGNIIPLRDAIRIHGADSIRLTILISAESITRCRFQSRGSQGNKEQVRKHVR